MPSENRSKKRRQKRRRQHQLRVECGGVRAACRNARFLLRKVFAMIFGGNLFTPPLQAECGGFCSHTRRPPHSTKPLALVYVKKLIRILAASGRTLAIHGRILPQKMQPRSQKTMSRNHETSSKIDPKTQKTIKMSKNNLRAEKVAPRIGNGAEKGQGVPN